MKQSLKNCIEVISKWELIAFYTQSFK
jgi:hypothetical protein